MLLNTGAAANAVHPLNAAEAFKNHLRVTFSSFDTKEIKLSLRQGVVKPPVAGAGNSEGRSCGCESWPKRQHLKYLEGIASGSAEPSGTLALK